MKGKRMESNKSYFLVGVFVVLTVAAGLLFTIWLGAKDSGDFVHYRIRFAESVSGLNVGGVVKYRGVNVGSVETIQIDRHDTRLILVQIKVDKNTPIKTDTVASLKLQGITGVIFIELTGGSNTAPNLLDVSKAEIPEIKAQSSPLNAIVDRLPQMVDKTEHGIEQINKLLSDENIANISAMVTEWQRISQELSVQVAALGPVIRNSAAVSRDLKEITQNSKGDITETVNNLNRSSQNLDALLRDMRRTSRNISNLSDDISEDPSRLIFPSQQKGIPAP